MNFSPSPPLSLQRRLYHIYTFMNLSLTHTLPPPPPPPQPGFQSIYMIMENGFKYFRFQLICRIKKTRIDSTFTMWRVLENIFMFKCFSNGISSSQSGTFSYIIVVYQNIGRYYGILRPRPHFPHKRTWYKQ